MADDTTLVELDGGRPIWVVTFSANGEYLVTGDDEAVRVWRMADGKEVGTLATYDVRSIAVSRDGLCIAAGTELGRVTVWEAHTYEKIFTHKDSGGIRAIDFSPDSTRLVTASGNCMATIWDISAHKQVLGPLHHQHGIVAAKYSLQGDRIATYADPGSVRVYDSHNGQLLLDTPVNVAVYCNTGLSWSNDGHHLFVVSDGKIKQLQVFTGSIVSEWPVHGYRSYACIILSKRGQFIAYSSNRTVNFLDVSTGAPLGQVIQHDQDIHSIALSSDDRLLATSTGDRKITIRSLPDTFTLSSINASPCGPFLSIKDTVFDSWKRGQLAETEALLTEDINPENPNHHALAYRALIRTRLRRWDAAIHDAEESINVQPSVIGLIAKGVALVGEGKKKEGYRTCDLAFKYCHSDHVDIVLAIKAVVVWMAGEYTDAISRTGDIIAMTCDNPIYLMLQAYMYLLCGFSYFEHQDYEGAIRSFELAQIQMRHPTSQRLWIISLISGWQFDDLSIRIQRHLCEALYAAGRTKQAEDVLLKMVNTVVDMTNMTEPTSEWIDGFIRKCLSTAESSGDATSEADRREQAMTLCSSKSSLGLPTRMLLLTEWVRIKLASSPWRDVLAGAIDFAVPKNVIYRVICERLEMAERIADATDCFSQMVNEPAAAQGEEAHWILDFKNRCFHKLEGLGDVATNARRHDEAISQYSAALTLSTTALQGLLVKRSKAYIAKGLSKDALNDANEIIKLDPSSPLGYERKHAALRVEGCYTDAIDAFETMLSMMLQSSDSEIRERYQQYVKPRETKAMIRKAVQDVVRDLPRVLINTTSGRLLNKSEQGTTFESSPVFTKLVSSMTTYIDTTRIKTEVAQYYRYATFSHAWEENEPLFENVAHIVVYDLEQSFTHGKLQMFCKVVRDAGVSWAWSDTCCVDRQDHVALQEALAAMFRWYEGSALMIVFLRGVRSPSKRGDLLRSTWNTRVWTFQAYHAAKVVRFYTEDWTPYLNLDVPNHKESPEIISEMEEATGISAGALKALRPGLNDIREKLSLASRRQAAFVEDTAYSLFGIFSVSLPVVYGEGDSALGRVLAHLLASSGDASILAWTGKSGGFNSCLPADIAVFNQLPGSHFPPTPLETTMDTVAIKLYASSLSLTFATRLYDQLSILPALSVSGKRIRIPCISFRLGHPRHMSRHVFRAMADALGIVEITTTEDLLQLESVYLIHPWIDFLLDRQPVGDGDGTSEKGDMVDGSLLHSPSSFSGSSSIALVGQRTPIAGVVARLWQSLGAFQVKSIHESASLSPSSLASLTERRTQVLRFITRLRQPFGALLVTPTRDNAAEYRRIATDSMITVRIQQDTPLDSLIPNIRMLDML